jgi:hypothetical protein
MDLIVRLRPAIAVAASAVLFAGCGTPSLPTVSPQDFGGARSWMAPEAASQDLLYVSDARGLVDVFSYPGGTLLGELKDLQSPAGVCSDPSGNVFVVNTNGLDVLEYKHGGTKPIFTLHDFGYYGMGCSVDPTTENVAVANSANSFSLGPGSIAIFDGGRSLAHYYEDRNFNSYLFCGYDDKGNLFVDGADVGSYHTLFAELPSGSSAFKDITLDRSIGFPGGVQWGGKYVAVGDAFADALYRFKIAGTKGTSAGKVSFKSNHSNLISQFWIGGATIVEPYGSLNRETRKVGFWPYPAGGMPSLSIDVPRSTELVSATVSVATHR